MNDYAKAPLYVMNKATADKRNLKYITITNDIVLAAEHKPKWSMMEANAATDPINKAGLGDILVSLSGDEQFNTEGSNSILVITTENGQFGAIALFYKGVLRGLKDYWLVPSSVHEWLAFPKSVIDKESLTKMIREVNEAEVRPHERLSDRPYVAVYRGKWTIEEA